MSELTPAFILSAVKFISSLGAGGMLGAALLGFLYFVPAAIFAFYPFDFSALIGSFIIGGFCGTSIVQFITTNNPKKRLKESRTDNTILEESFLTKLRIIQNLEAANINLPQEEINKIKIGILTKDLPFDNVANTNPNQLPESTENPKLPSSDQSEE
jgi:hypothetical protein